MPTSIVLSLIQPEVEPESTVLVVVMLCCAPSLATICSASGL